MMRLQGRDQRFLYCFLRDLCRAQTQTRESEHRLAMRIHPLGGVCDWLRFLQGHPASRRLDPT